MTYTGMSFATMITMLRWGEESTNSQVVIDLINVNFTRKVMEKNQSIFFV